MKPFDALAFLRQLMNVDSQTLNVLGVEEVQRMIAQVLRDRGFDVELIAHPAQASAHLLAATKVIDPDAPWINFIGHADTILPNFPLELSSKIWRGSGIADNKGGVVTLLQTLWCLREIELPFNLRIVISPNEETGSEGFQGLFRLWGQEAFLNLGFEPSLENDELISSRSGNRWYEVKLATASTHAGRSSKGRVNPLHRTAAFTLRLEEALRDEPRIKFNVTSLKTANECFGVIPGELTLKLDARFNSLRGKEKFHALFEAELRSLSADCAVSDTPVSATYTVHDDCPPMDSSLELNVEGIPYCFVHAGGTADINRFSQPKNFSIDGWGARGGEFHSKEEWVDTTSIFERAEVLRDWLVTLAKSFYPEEKTEIRIKPDSVLNYHSSRP